MCPQIMSHRQDKKFSQAGIAALPVIILTSFIVVELVVAGVLVAYLLNSSSLGVRRASETLSAAQAGILDATMKITRNKNFFTSSTSTLSFGNNLYAEVVVQKDGKHEIKSIGYISIGGTRRFSRQLRVILNVNALTGKTELESFEEISI